MEYPEFVQVMTTTLTQHATKAAEMSQAQDLTEEEREAMQQALLPFELTATAYRRYTFDLSRINSSLASTCKQTEGCIFRGNLLLVGSQTDGSMSPILMRRKKLISALEKGNKDVIASLAADQHRAIVSASNSKLSLEQQTSSAAGKCSPTAYSFWLLLLVASLCIISLCTAFGGCMCKSGCGK